MIRIKGVFNGHNVDLNIEHGFKDQYEAALQGDFTGVFIASVYNRTLEEAPTILNKATIILPTLVKPFEAFRKAFSKAFAKYL